MFWRSFTPQALSDRWCGYKYTNFVFLCPVQSPSVSPMAITLRTSCLFSDCVFSQHVTLVFCHKNGPQCCPHLPSDIVRKIWCPKGQFLHCVDFTNLFQMRLILTNFAKSLSCFAEESWMTGRSRCVWLLYVACMSVGDPLNKQYSLFCVSCGISLTTLFSVWFFSLGSVLV